MSEEQQVSEASKYLAPIIPAALGGAVDYYYKHLRGEIQWTWKGVAGHMTAALFGGFLMYRLGLALGYGTNDWGWVFASMGGYLGVRGADIASVVLQKRAS